MEAFEKAKTQLPMSQNKNYPPTIHWLLNSENVSLSEHTDHKPWPYLKKFWFPNLHFDVSRANIRREI